VALKVTRKSKTIIKKVKKSQKNILAFIIIITDLF